jgi:hypothetical protein
MKTRNFILLFNTAIFVYGFLGCTKEGPIGPAGKDANNDKQIMLTLDFFANTTSIDGVIGLGLIKFDKRNYVGVDSIIFVSRPYSGDINSKSIVELYNISDNLSINNSLLESNQPLQENNYLESGNLFSMLPEKEINLGIRIRSEKEGSFAGVYNNSYLFLYRK